MSSGIIETIKKVALDAFTASKPVNVLWGEVTSVDPITITINQYLSLTEEFLVINGEVFKGDKVTLIRVQGGQKYVVLGTRTEYVKETVYVGGVSSNSVVDKAIEWALRIANDNSHGYSNSIRWGPHYDCSSFVLSAYYQAGLPIFKGNESKWGTTETMYSQLTKVGFVDVTSRVNIDSGEGLMKGDVVLKKNYGNTYGHTAIVVSPGTLVHAGSSKTGILTRSYYNGYSSSNPKKWQYVLRYTG